MLSLPASRYQRLTGRANGYQPLLRAAQPTDRAHTEHTEPPLIAAVPTPANRYQRLPTSTNDSPSTHRAHRKIQMFAPTKELDQRVPGLPRQAEVPTNLPLSLSH